MIDHTCTDVEAIPMTWIDRAKERVFFGYQHSSHGGQVIKGLMSLQMYPDFTQWDRGVRTRAYGFDDTAEAPRAGNLFINDHNWPDEEAIGLFPDPEGEVCNTLTKCGNPDPATGEPRWVLYTRAFLDDPDNDYITVVMWAWGGVEGEDIESYLDGMEMLIAEYGQGGTAARATAHPVTFVFMTSFADGQGDSGIAHTANERIRAHARDRGRVLFDYGDIEAYDPGGTYYGDAPVWPNLNYGPALADGSHANWGEQWVAANAATLRARLTVGEPDKGWNGTRNCAHSNLVVGANLNCVLKGGAFWWLAARLAGWDAAPAQ